MLRTMLTHARKHPSLIPLFLFVGCGGVGSLLYALRVTMRSPEIAWDKKNNPEPWNKRGPNYQYKFYNETVDYKNLKKEGPDY
ncbi:PREDICTED: cytochrome c oxidase subunit NDUFA4 [Nanorana parkeri]|uniref:cytochrome c oxidase subunit NDUFA4 n=1 Tax=Nanorana parkeri TaxID=125878 RepID=UPI0008549A99|nr:PREDICTED: cytochrome c oxidase subunit NDUFA4 [Nanorana parkeri]